MEILRFSSDASIVIVFVQDGHTTYFHVADQADMDRLPVGKNLTEEEITGLDD